MVVVVRGEGRGCEGEGGRGERGRAGCVCLCYQYPLIGSLGKISHLCDNHDNGCSSIVSHCNLASHTTKLYDSTSTDPILRAIFSPALQANRCLSVESKTPSESPLTQIRSKIRQ